MKVIFGFTESRTKIDDFKNQNLITLQNILRLVIEYF